MENNLCPDLPLRYEIPTQRSRNCAICSPLLRYFSLLQSLSTDSARLIWPSGVATFTTPDVAPGGTVAVISELETTVNVTLNGPRWMTGGTVGPEASVICPLVLAVVAILFSLRHREAQLTV